MNQKNITIGKTIVALVWAVCLVSVFAPTSFSFSSIFQGLAIFLVAAHAIEIFVYRSRLNSSGDYVQTFLFGLLHIKMLALTHRQKNTAV